MSTRSKREVWVGRIVTAMVTMMLAGSAIAKLAAAPKMVMGLVRAGIPRPIIPTIAVLELSCLALFLFPRTAMLGTLLLTGYFGGATLTHIISGESIFPPLLAGLLIWSSAYVRVPELRNLLPVHKTEMQSQVSSGARTQQPLPTPR